jgi:hypothetical protein
MAKQQPPPSIGRLAASLAIAFVVIAVAWWFLYPHPRHNNDLAILAVSLVGGFAAAVLNSRKK